MLQDRCFEREFTCAEYAPNMRQTCTGTSGNCWHVNATIVWICVSHMRRPQEMQVVAPSKQPKSTFSFVSAMKVKCVSCPH